MTPGKGSNYREFYDLSGCITCMHAKFQDHRTSGSGEEEYLRFLPYMGMAAILVM